MKKLKLIFFILLILFVASCTNPLFAKVKSSSTKTLQRPEDIVITNRKANFGIGDIINLDIASIRIVNDQTPAYLLLELELDIDSPSISDDKNAVIKFVKKFESNESFTFTNKDLLNYLQYYKGGDIPQSIKNAFGITNKDSITDSFFNSSNKNLPEGEYTISLSAYEIETENNLIGRELREKQSVSFKVANIEAIKILQKPTVKDMTLKFQIPEIPYYSDWSIPNYSQTEIKITGPDFSNTIYKSHQRVSASKKSDIKGYPADLKDGIVTYDLSSIELRAGETYTFNIRFIDAYNHLIKEKTFNINFPTPKFSSSISFDEPFSPNFNWSFNDDYASWVSEYHIYINDNYATTKNNNYKYKNLLNSNSTYSWYVMPINKDGTNFFVDSENKINTFKTKIHNEIDLDIVRPTEKSTLIVGKTYNFLGKPIYSDKIDQKLATWHIGTSSINGTSINYTPTKKYSSNSLLAYLNIEDELGLTKNSPYLYLSTIDPIISLADDYSSNILKDSTVTFSIDQNINKTRDLDTVEWFIDGKSIGTGYNTYYKFSEIGSYSIYAKGTSLPDYLNHTKEVYTKTINVEVIGKEPIATIELPTDYIQILKGTPLNLQSKYMSYNPAKSFEWAYSGENSGSLGSDDSETTFSSNIAGEYTITFKVTDIYNKSDTASLRVLVIDPQITISNIKPNAIYSNLTTLKPIVSAPGANKYFYLINGKEITNENLELAGYSSGIYKFSVRGVWNVFDSNGRITTYEKESEAIPFEVIEKKPPVIEFVNPTYPYRFIQGMTYKLKANVTTTAPIKSSWWKVNNKILSSNTFTPSMYSTQDNNYLQISYNVEDEDGLFSSKSYNCRVLYPAVNIISPIIKDIPISGKINVEASTRDSNLYWTIDGIEQPNWDKTISELGEHIIQAGWRVNALDSNGNIKNFNGLSKEVPVTIYLDQDPEIISFIPSKELIKHIVNTELNFSIKVSEGHVLQPTSWSISQYPNYNNGLKFNSETLSYSNWKRGIYKVKALSKDIYDRAAEQEWTINVIEPFATITYPKNNDLIALNQLQNPQIYLQDVDDYVYTLNGKIIDKDYDWNNLAEGDYTLSVEGLYTIDTKPSQQKTKAHTVSFTIKDLTPPEFEISIIKNNDRVISNQTYNLKTYGDGDATYSWYLNGRKVKSGSSYSYKPNLPNQYSRSKYYYDTIKIIATRNGIKNEKIYKVNIINPSYSIILNAGIPKGNKIYLTNDTNLSLYYTANFIDKVVWKVDGKTINNSSKISFNKGTHTVNLYGYATGVRFPNGRLSDYMPEKSENTKKFEIVDHQEVVSIDAPSAVVHNQRIDIKAITNTKAPYNFMDSFTCYIDGSLHEKNKSGIFSLKSLSAGTHTIQIVSIDKFGKRATESQDIKVYTPLVTKILTPLDGQRLSPDCLLIGQLKIYSGEPDKITWKIDNKIIPFSNSITVNLGKLYPGKHSITTNIVDILNNEVNEKVDIETLTDFQLNMLKPTTSVEIIKGTSIDCLAGVDKVIGSSISVTDAARNITWYLNGKKTKTTGLSYTFKTDIPGKYKIYAEYDFNDMIRTTNERTIVVRDIKDPIITSPLNGSTITYPEGYLLELKAAGEVGAEYVWKNKNETIAVGPNAKYDPKGLTGEVQLSLTTKAYNQSKQASVTYYLKKNSPPTLALDVPPIQYTGEELTFSAKASDIEDNTSTPTIIYELDGVRIDENNSYILKTIDVGMHSLVATAIDSLKEETRSSITFNVVEKILPLEILTPHEDSTYYKGYEIPLIASIPQGEEGTYSWTVQYLDNTSVKTEVFKTKKSSFIPKAIGKVEITTTFIDSNNIERAKKHTLLNIENEPINLSINWPHGTVVNQNEKLNPMLLGLPEKADINSVKWYLGGSEITNIEELTAPSEKGEYTLSALYLNDDESHRSAIDFTVNEKPTVTIDKTISSIKYKINDPIILAANVDDDQPFSGEINWYTNNDELIGEGNPIIYTPLTIGTYSISAKVSDNYNLKDTDTISIETYKEISQIASTVNNGLPSYLISNNSKPLTLTTTFKDGNSPKAKWIISQGTTVLTKTGKLVEFNYEELNVLNREPIIISLIIEDTSSFSDLLNEVYRKDYIINLTQDASVEIVNPTSSSMYRIGQDIPVEIALTGYSNPILALSVNDIAISSEWKRSSDNLSATTSIDPTKFSKDGVYEIEIKALENDILTNHILSLNIYPNRKGIFIEDAPDIFDKNTKSQIITAVTPGLSEVDQIIWKNDISDEAISLTDTLDLAKANLTSGKHSILVEAFNNGESIASTSIILDVLDNIFVTIDNESDPLIIHKGADVALNVEAIDRDGTTIDGDNITWKSHDTGFLGNGSTLFFKELSKLSVGTHIITAEAIGKSGSINYDYLTVEIKEGEIDDIFQEDNHIANTIKNIELNETNEKQVQERTSIESVFDSGVPIATDDSPRYLKPFGPGKNSNIDTGLMDKMNSFTNSSDAIKENTKDKE